MILRRYGSTFESVDTAFDPNALTEIGFRRNRAFSVPSEEFEAGWQRVRVHEMGPRTTGPVQIKAEGELLETVQEELDGLLEALEEGEVLVVENQQGVDWPKTCHVQKQSHFEHWVEPPLRIGIYRKSS